MWFVGFRIFKLAEDFSFVQFHFHFCLDPSLFSRILLFLQFDSGFGSLVNSCLTRLIWTSINCSHYLRKSIFRLGSAYKNQLSSALAADRLFGRICYSQRLLLYHIFVLCALCLNPRLVFCSKLSLFNSNFYPRFFQSRSWGMGFSKRNFFEKKCRCKSNQHQERRNQENFSD